MNGMLLRLENFIAWRYLHTRGGNHFISFISLTSMFGVGLGVMALIVVLSVMNGFEQELKSRILGMVSHATLTDLGQSALGNWPELVERIEAHERVVGAAPFYSGEGMLSAGNQVQGAMVRGIVPQHEVGVSRIEEYMRSGTLDSLQGGTFNAVIGTELAAFLDLQPGDALNLMVAEMNITPVGILPRFKRFTVSGIFEVGMHEYDSALILIHLDDACRLFRCQAPDSIRIQTDDLLLAPRIAREAQSMLAGDYYLSDWTQHHVNFFRALRTEKTVMFIILALIVAVAAFNIISTLIMMVAEKRSDIAVLRTMGASPGHIMRIFVIQGGLIGVLGVGLGAVSGILLALNVETLVPWIESFFNTDLLPSDVYYITDLPSELRWQDVTLITALSLFLCLVATVYPAVRAARVQPARALRHE